MADPLSIAASVAGLITLATSTVKLAKTMSDRYTEKAAASIRGNAEILDTALTRINKSLEDQTYTGPGEEALREPVESCARSLRDIEMQFQNLDMKGNFISNMAGRLARPDILKEIQKLQVSLEGQKTTLLIAMQNCSGESQNKMLHMIFGAIEDLRSIIKKEQVTNEPVSDHAMNAQTTNSIENTSVESVVQTYASFDDWLSSWTVAEENQGTLAAPVSGESSQNKGPTANSPTVPSGPQRVKLIIEGLQQAGHEGAITKEIITTSDTSLCDIISELDETLSQTVVNKLSNNHHEYERICGFIDTENGAKFPPFMPRDASIVTVTDGSSSYIVRDGLRVNRHERLIDFYNECIRANVYPKTSTSPLVKKKSSRIVVRNAFDPQHCTNITFQRTLRLPNDRHFQRSPSISRRWQPGIYRSEHNSHRYSSSKYNSFEHGNPYYGYSKDSRAPGTSDFLGSFPLFNVEDYKEKLPPEMHEKGGMFFPIFQREGLAISFTKGEPTEADDYGGAEQFAIRVYAGSINCFSGKTATETGANEQDYVICPMQKRLDGYKDDIDGTRQFVAMPLGWQYSAEHQITGTEGVGGIQLQIAAPLWDHVDFRVHEDFWRLGRSLRFTDSASDSGLENGSVIVMSNFKTDAKLHSACEILSINGSQQRSRPDYYPTTCGISRFEPPQYTYHVNDSRSRRVSTVQDLIQMRGKQGADPTSSI
nr:uncharacterized protein CTRU02_02548 [Colletotrichum truncatum]KAF6798574.1 integral membrane protein [Colletotrichum truncatum]